MSASGDAAYRTPADAASGRLAWLALSAAIVVLDQASKWYFSTHLIYGEPVEVLPVFDLTLLHNTGAAFSFLAGQGGWQRWFFTALAVGVSVLITWWLYRLSHDEPRTTAAALALVLGGAVGNVIDRMRFGYVVDFIHLHYREWYFPAFNIADSAITVGAVILGAEILFGRRRSQAQ